MAVDLGVTAADLPSRSYGGDSSVHLQNHTTGSCGVDFRCVVFTFINPPSFFYDWTRTQPFHSWAESSWGRFFAPLFA